MSKERPILFSAQMVRAILADKKTQTRRLIAVDPKSVLSCQVMDPHEVVFENPNALVRVPYHAGDRLVVREAWRTAAELDTKSPVSIGAAALEAGYEKPWTPLVYEADGFRRDWAFGTPGKLRPGIRMPRWASRIQLEVTSVRVERLQDISEDDARAEGVVRVRDACHVIRGYDYDLAGLCHTSAVTPFQSLWDSINGKRAPWDSNPWVWVVGFKRVEAE